MTLNVEQIVQSLIANNDIYWHQANIKEGDAYGRALMVKEDKAGLLKNLNVELRQIGSDYMINIKSLKALLGVNADAILVGEIPKRDTPKKFR